MNLNDYKVPDYKLNVRVQTHYESDPLGGQTSGTSRAHRGIKPKEVYVTLDIPMREPELLEALTEVSEATDKTGALMVYDLQDETANSMKVRQVQFYGVLTVQEKESVRAWRVDFTLIEYFSVPEKTEQRITTADAPAQVADGVTVTGTNQEGEEVKLSPSYWRKALDALESYLEDDKAEAQP